MCDPGTGAAIAGGANAAGSIGGKLMDKTMQDPQGEKSEVKVYPPGYEDFRARLLGILDAGMRSYGFDKFIPQERMPYELRSPEERAQIQEQWKNLTPEQRDRANFDARPEYNAPPTTQYQFPESEAEPERGSGRPAVNTDAMGPPEEEVQRQQLAQAIQARRMNIGQSEPLLGGDRMGSMQVQAAQQQPLNDAWNFIYGGRLGTRRFDRLPPKVNG